MAQRRFGPVRGAGTVIVEKESERTIQASAFGSTAMVGVMERGPVGELIEVSGKRDLLAKTGGYIPGSLLPDAAIDFWDHSEGAGVMFLYRVTDGSEKKASLTLYDRKASRNQVVRLDAKNGGGWGGRRKTIVFDLADVAADIAETTIEAPIALTLLKDELKGATLQLTGANGGSGGSYEVIGNDASDGTTKTTITLAADSKADTEYGAASDPEAVLLVPSLDGFGQGKFLAAEIKDGVLNPSTEWGLAVYLNGDLVRDYPDLSSDPASANYFVNIINDDGENHYVDAVDLWVGSITADVRPANAFGSVAAATEITASKLDISTAAVLVDASQAGTNTIAAFTFGAQVIPGKYECELTGANTWQLTSLDNQAQHVFAAPPDGAAYSADNPFSIGFTVTAVSNVTGEKFTLTVLPLVEDEAIQGRIFFPEVSGAPAGGWLISDNTETEADIASGDLTVGGTVAGNVKFRLQYQQQFSGGYDGIANLDTNDFLPAFDVGSSPFNDTAFKGYGLIKYSAPGISAYSSPVDPVIVQKAGVAYASAKNHQYRVEIPKNITDDFAAKAYVQDTIGKNTYEKVTFPSWASYADPLLPGRLKDVSLSGAFLGREAKVARDFLGYHKAAAGVDVTLPKVVRLPTGDRILDQEILNPAGIQMVLLKGGNFVMWGARIPSTDSAFKFAIHREQLSYYEHVFQESFDFIIFAINDPLAQPPLIAAFNAFLLPEWRKRALRGDSPQQAFSIKIDAENNTDLTRAAGDLNAEIKLKLAETVERFVITISKAGVFEDLEA